MLIEVRDKELDIVYKTAIEDNTSIDTALNKLLRLGSEAKDKLTSTPSVTLLDLNNIALKVETIDERLDDLLNRFALPAEGEDCEDVVFFKKNCPSLRFDSSDERLI